MQKIFISILFLLVMAGLPAAAHAITVTITVNGVVVAQSVDVPPCLIPPGATSCIATAPIPIVNTSDVIILDGGVAEAEADADNSSGTTPIPGVVNIIRVTGLALLYQGALPTATVEITYSNRFPLPDLVWTTPGFGGFSCDPATLFASDTGSSICRNYGFTATGSFCRLDSSGACGLTADPDTASMTESVTFEQANNGTTATQDIGTGLSYQVAFGSVANNDFFPLAKVGVADQNVACDLLIRGPCASVETQTNTLVFALNQGDAIFLFGSPIGVAGTNPGQVNNRLKFAEIDIQPIYDPGNNDLNLTSSGTRTVAVLSSSTFDPRTIKPGTVFLRVGGGGPVAPIGNPTFRDLNHDGIKDAIFTFSIPALAAAGGNCSPAVAVLSGTGTFTSTYQKIIGGTKKKPTFQTVTVTEDLEFDGSQSFTCAPSAGF